MQQNDKYFDSIKNFWSDWYFWPATRWYGEKYGCRSAFDEPILIKEAAKEDTFGPKKVEQPSGLIYVKLFPTKEEEEAERERFRQRLVNHMRSEMMLGD